MQLMDQHYANNKDKLILDLKLLIKCHKKRMVSGLELCMALKALQWWKWVWRNFPQATAMLPSRNPSFNGSDFEETLDKLVEMMQSTLSSSGVKYEHLRWLNIEVGGSRKAGRCHWCQTTHDCCQTHDHRHRPCSRNINIIQNPRFIDSNYISSYFRFGSVDNGEILNQSAFARYIA